MNGISKNSSFSYPYKPLQYFIEYLLEIRQKKEYIKIIIPKSSNKA